MQILKIRLIRSLKKFIADKISQQPENCENRNDPDLVQAFLKKWWVESDFKDIRKLLFQKLNIHLQDLGPSEYMKTITKLLNPKVLMTL
jgi:hypothetical protein